MPVKKHKLNKKLLHEITKKIVGAFDVEKIILFGSFAYGKPWKDSDVDLFIIMESEERPSERRIMVGNLFLEREMPMDFIVKTPNEVEKRLKLGDSFVEKILKSGIVLYEKREG